MPPIELVGGGSVRVGGWSSRPMMIRAFLFAPLFARFARGQLPSQQLWRHMIRVCSRVSSCVFACVFVCVFVCVRAFAPYLPPLPARLPGVGVVVVVVVKRS